MTEQQDVVQVWLTSLEQEGKSRSTLQGYARGVRHFVRWFEQSGEEPFSPDRVIPRDVRDWIAYQQTVEKAKPRTIGFRLTALRRFFEWCQREGVVRAAPTGEVRAPRPPHGAPRALSKAEERRLLRAVYRGGRLRDIAIVELLLGAGLRVGELLALRVGDVEIGKRSGKVIVRRGKHGQYREIPLVKEARRALSKYLKKHPRKDDADAPLWWGQRGPLNSRTSIWDILQKYAYQARVQHVTPHMLRHTFATRYLEANPGDVRGLAALLGHSRLDTVMVYTEPAFEDLAERMERRPRVAGDDV